MKRSCKDIDITDKEMVYPWVLECVLRHKNRHDFRGLLHRVGGMDKQSYYDAIARHDESAFYAPAERIAQESVRRIAKRQLELKAVEIRERIDRSSGKLRMIGKESAMQQIFDHIAVGAAEEVWRRRIVPQQASSIKGRGQLYGTKMIRKWVCADDRAARWAHKHKRAYSRKCKYFVKLDVQKCYQSMRAETFMKHFQHDCGNETLLWLWETLLKSHRVDGYEGFMIGALPSQWACQYIMSYVYRYAMDLAKTRRGKRMKLVSHGLIYMDDILLLAPSRKNLKTAVRKVIRYAREQFGLTIKPNWQICRLDDAPIDMMGYVIHADGSVTIRPRVFLRARRSALRIMRHDRKLTRKLAQRMCSYKGYFTNSDSCKVSQKLRLDDVLQQAAQEISKQERRKNSEHNTIY